MWALKETLNILFCQFGSMLCGLTFENLLLLFQIDSPKFQLQKTNWRSASRDRYKNHKANDNRGYQDPARYLGKHSKRRIQPPLFTSNFKILSGVGTTLQSWWWASNSFKSYCLRGRSGRDLCKPSVQLLAVQVSHVPGHRAQGDASMLRPEDSTGIAANPKKQAFIFKTL